MEQIKFGSCTIDQNWSRLDAHSFDIISLPFSAEFSVLPCPI